MSENIIKSNTNVNSLITNLRILSIEQAKSIAKSCYSHEAFSRMAFSLCVNTFEPRFSKKKVNNSNENSIYDNFGKCIIETSRYRYPSMTNFIKEFKFFSGTTNLVGTKVFSVEILDELSKEFQLQVLIKDLVEKNIKERYEDESFLIALYKKDDPKWRIAFVYKHLCCPKFKDGTEWKDMGQNKIMVVFYDPKLLLIGINKGLNIDELSYEKQIIKLNKLR